MTVAPERETRDPAARAAGAETNGLAQGPGSPPGPVPRQPRIFFGWYIVAGGAVLSAILGGLMFHAFGQYVVVFEEEFGWSRTALSVAFSVQMVESGLLGPVQGFALDRYGPRRIMMVGITIFAIGFLLLSRINTLPAFYGAFLVIALGMSIGSMMGVSVAVVNWFNRRRALAMAIMSLGFAAGGFLQPAVAWSLDNIGWRDTSVVSGLVVLFVGLPLAGLMRHRPEQYGYRVDGDPPGATAGGDRTGPGAAAVEINFTWQEAMRTRAFWLISIGHAFALLIMGAVMVHFVAHLNDSLGYSLSQAANVILLITVTSIAGMLIGGILGDRMPMRYILAVAMLGHMASLIVLTVMTSAAGVIVFAALHGLSFGVRGPLTMAIRADYFGRAAFGTVMGFSSLIILIGMVAGPIIAGLSFDLTGDYRAGFVVLAAIAGLGAFVFLVSTPPDPPPRLAARPPDGERVEAAATRA